MTETKTEQLGTFEFTKPVRCLTYPQKGPQLFKAMPFLDKNGKAKGEPKFGCVLVIPNDHPDLAALKAKAIAVAQAQWPGEDIKEMFPKKPDGERQGWPLKSGDIKAAKREAAGKKGDLTAGTTMLTARSMFQPKLGGIENGVPVDYDTDDKLAKAQSKFYPGVEVFAGVNFVANEVDDKKSVTCYLNMVFSLNKGERVGGGRSAAEAFKGYVGQVQSENPAAGMDNEEF